MSRYRKIDGGTWGDRRFRNLSQDGKLLWFYLLTGPQVTSLPGVLVLGKATIAEAFEWGTRRVNNAIAELTKTTDEDPVPMIKTDWKCRLVWLPRALKYNFTGNPDAVRGWGDHWRATPECELKLEIEAELRTHLEALVSDKAADCLREFNELSGKEPPLSRSRKPPKPPPSTPPSTQATTHSSSPSPTPPISLARARAVTDPVTAPVLSGDQKGVAEVKADHPRFELGGARCEKACEVFVDAIAERERTRPPIRDKWDREALCDTINTFLNLDQPVLAVLDDLRSRVCDWVDSVVESDSVAFTNGWSPKKFAGWLSTQPKPEPKRQPKGVFAKPFRNEWDGKTGPLEGEDSHVSVTSVADNVTPDADVTEITTEEWERRRAHQLETLSRIS